MCCGYRHRHIAVDRGKYISSGKVSINALEGFWSLFWVRLIKHHGVSNKIFVLSLDELEFGDNYRQQETLMNSANTSVISCQMFRNTFYGTGILIHRPKPQALLCLYCQRTGKMSWVKGLYGTGKMSPLLRRRSS